MRKIVILLFCLTLSACAGTLKRDFEKYTSLDANHFKDTATISDNRLKRTATISTQKGHETSIYLTLHNHSDNFIRAFVNKETGRATYQIYTLTRYSAKRWAFLNSVSYENKDRYADAKLTQIHSEVTSCNTTLDTCSYEEHVGFIVPEDHLLSHLQWSKSRGERAFNYVISTKTAGDIDFFITDNEIEGLMLAVKEYLRNNK